MIKRTLFVFGFLSWSLILLTWSRMAYAQASNPDFGFVIEEAIVAFIELLKFLNEMAQLVW